MIFRYLLRITLCVSVILPAQSRQPTAQQLTDSVSADRLSAHIDSLQRAGGHWSRANFTPGNDSAVAYIVREFKKIPQLTSVVLDTFYVPTAAAPYNTKPMFNVVATLEGSGVPASTILLGAHLDACGSRIPEWNEQWQTLRIPGADDNATGVATVLEAARILGSAASGAPFDKTIRFIAFGVEETGPAYTGYTFGSLHAAQQARERGETIAIMMSVDMVGYNDHFPYLSIVADSASHWISNRMVDINGSAGIEAILAQSPQAYTWSDHASYWKYGFPAVCLIEAAPPTISNPLYTANTYFHTGGDTLGLLNITLVKKATQLVVASAAGFSRNATDVETGLSHHPSAFVLEQNYPNPFNPTTTISYALPQDGLVLLKIYDALGREVSTLVNEFKQTGRYTTTFPATGGSASGGDASKLSSGVYIYKLTSGKYCAAKKMMLVK